MKNIMNAFDDISKPDLICFSHLRWNFVFQRPQHLMTRMARERRVFFFEEPIFTDESAARLHVYQDGENLYVATPHIPHGRDEVELNATMKELLTELIDSFEIAQHLSWYYSPMHLKHSYHLTPVVCVYDCMDQLANFKFAPQELPLLEQSLINKVDMVFTGGFSLYEAKKHLHRKVYPFPSSVDTAHFAKGRTVRQDPADQAHIPGPRFGFAGVIDERIDIELLDQVAAARPDWHFVMVGPVVKIDPASLPQRPNIHYLGGKPYEQLPEYLGGWDVAILPFAQNEATRYISPTKTPEYLAAGRRVISTSIRDVVHPYADKSLVSIADDAATFIEKAEAILADQAGYDAWLERVDQFLTQNSWDKTYSDMWQLIHAQYIVQNVVQPSAVYGTQA
jgi:UDP-galactopyranose mutase